MNFFARSLVAISTLFLVSCSAQKITAAKEGESWLFDGKSTEALRGYQLNGFPEKAWVVESGTLKTIVGGEVVDLVTKEKFENFDLQLEWKVSPGGNSGVMYHVTEDFPKSYNSGPEMQILDDSKHKDGGNPKTSTGALYALIAPTNKTLNAVGQWNQARLRVMNNRVEHWLNGKKIVEYDLSSKEIKDLIAKSKFKDMPGFAKKKSGHIVLQHHRDEVWFRNIRIQRL